MQYGSNMVFEDVFAAVGDNGHFQITTLLLLWCCRVYVGAMIISSVFVARDQAFWCANSREEDRYIASTPSSNSTCNYLSSNVSSTSLRECTVWRFAGEPAVFSIQSHYRFVCTWGYMVVISHTVFRVGISLGSVVGGVLCDRRGRVPTLVLALALSSAVGSLTPWSPHWALYFLGRMTVGLGTGAIQSTAHTLLSELVGTRVRVLYLTILSTAVFFGYCLVAVLSYALTSHVHLEVALSAPVALLMVSYYLIPESPKWLLVTGQVDEAVTAFSVIAKRNHVPLRRAEIMCMLPDQHSHIVPSVAPSKSANVCDLFGHSGLCRVTLIMWLNFAISNLVYVGLLLSSGTLTDNLQLYTLASSCADAVWTLIGGCGATRFGRIPWFLLLSALGGVSSIGCLILALLATAAGVHQSPSPALSVFSAASRFGACGLMFGQMAYAPELFPTSHRATATGSMYVVAKLVSILAPQMMLLSAVWYPLQFVVYIILFGLAGITLPFLPETRSLVPPDTLQESKLLNSKYFIKRILGNAGFTRPPLMT